MVETNSEINKSNTSNSTDNSMGKIVLDTFDIFGENIILSERCFDFHTDTDNKDQEDVNTRIKLLQNGHIEDTLIDPHYIYKDFSKPDVRHRYLKVIFDRDISNHFLGCLVVVDYKRTPKEIATWFPINKLTNQEVLPDTEAMIYDSNKK